MKFSATTLYAVFAAMLALPATVTANNPLCSCVVDEDLAKNHAKKLAMASRPMFHFAQTLKQKPCYPVSALQPDGSQTPYAEMKPYPQTGGGGCPDASLPAVHNPGPAFPVYYVYKKCSDSEIRIAYNLYFQKDGFWPDGLGHYNDWERVVVIWKWDGADAWSRDRILLSSHGGYHNHAWADVDTFNESDQDYTGHANADFAKVYVGWAKHAIFRERKTTFSDLLSQFFENEYRSNDWWFWPGDKDLEYAGSDSDIGKAIGSMDWGHATSNPPSVENGLCDAK
ncbi:hypothetical protein RUND412_001580 [Rhizina undulata]